MRFLSILIMVLALVITSNAAPYKLDSDQIVLVISENWDTHNATMHLLDKRGRDWRPYRKDLPVTIGRNGLGWGLGMHPTDLPGVDKKEGDGKAPCGIFKIGDCMGYTKYPPFNLKMNYVQLLPTMHGVDDGESKYYNQIVDIRDVDGSWKDHWDSHETMRRKDVLYKWLYVVHHNQERVPYRGSMIFIHIWRGPDKPTSGCTAMTEYNILDMIRWMDKRNRPVLVQLTRDSYEKYGKEWNLPLGY